MTFDGCTFIGENSAKIVNVDADQQNPNEPEGPRVINFKDCTVKSQGGSSMKSVLNIHDAHNIPEAKIGEWIPKTDFVVYFTGNNKVTGLKANSNTCSRLFQVEIVGGGIYDRWKDTYGVTVYIGGEKVWENGKMVKHNMDITAGSYENGVAEGSENKYTDGYKDNAFTVTETGWVQQPDGSYKWMVTRVCKYCGYEETVEETKRDDITAVLLPALQANTDDHYSYLIGYADGTVRPNGKITRAEVATIFFRLLDDDTRAKYWSSENNFSDVSADKWYNNAVSTLSRMGVIGGYADGTFRPDAPISRAEFAKIAVSFTQNNGSAVYNYFTDVKTTDWFAPYVTAAKDAGLIEGYSDGSFKPESKITRAEACAIVNRTLGRKPSKAHMKISDRIDWPDVQTTDWFYEAIMEATNSHTCTMGDRVETWTGKLPQRDWATLETGWANAYTGR